MNLITEILIDKLQWTSNIGFINKELNDGKKFFLVMASDNK